MSDYNYMIATDFPGGAWDSDNLKKEILESSITTQLRGVNSDGSSVKIVFASELSAAEKTVLDGDTSKPAGGLIAAHNSTKETPLGDITERFGSSNMGARTASDVDLWSSVTRDTQPDDGDIQVGHGILWRDEASKSLYLRVKLSDETCVNVKLGTWT